MKLKENSSETLNVFKALGIGSILNFCLSWLPMAPVLNVIGGFCGALLLQKFFANPKQPLETKHRRIFILVGAFISGLGTAYIFTLLFFIFLGKPAQDEWFKFMAYEQITRQSKSFRWNFFWGSALLGFLAFSLGSLMAFKLKISTPQPTDEKLLAELPSEKLEEYLEEA